jgi:hypothetical protein
MLSVPSFGRSGAKKISNANQDASGFLKNIGAAQTGQNQALEPALQTAASSGYGITAR